MLDNQPHVMEIMDKIVYTLLGVMSTLVFAFWKGYASKKAENVAAIEDTGAITRIQEAVKNEFQTQVAKMQFDHQYKFSLATERRNAIYELNARLYEFYSFTLNAMFNTKYYDKEQFPSFASDNFTAFSKMGYASERLHLLFLTDASWTDTLNAIQQRLDKIQKLALHFLEIYHNQPDRILVQTRFRETTFEVENEIKSVATHLTELRAQLYQLLTNL